MFGDEMIDEASRKMAIKFVSRGERAGLTPQPRLSQPMSRRAMTLRASVSSAPSKMESTRASTK